MNMSGLNVCLYSWECFRVDIILEVKTHMLMCGELLKNLDITSLEVSKYNTRGGDLIEFR